MSSPLLFDSAQIKSEAPCDAIVKFEVIIIKLELFCGFAPRVLRVLEFYSTVVKFNRRVTKWLTRLTAERK